MALINCPECKKEISSEANLCPSCGFHQKKTVVPSTTPKKSNFLILVSILIALIIILPFVLPDDERDYNSAGTTSSEAFNYMSGLEKVDNKKAINNLIIDHDKVANIFWRQHKNSPKYLNSRSTVYLYFGGTKERASNLRMRWQYTAEDWLFVQDITIKADSKTFDIIPTKKNRIERDNKNGVVWEWLDSTVINDDVVMFKAMANSKETIIRFNGSKYYKDVVLSKKDKAAILEMLVSYKNLNGVI